MTTQQQPYIPYNDPALPSSGTPIQPVLANGNVFITNINEYTTIRVSSPGEPAGNSTEVQFNFNGQMDGDDGLTYNPTTDSLDVLGNLVAANVLTDNLLYANGEAWSFDSTYSNANVANYLPTYTGNFNVTNVVATLFAGSGANLTNIPAGNIVGSISSATTATTAGTVTTAAQPNITAVGTLTSLSVTNTISGNVSGSAATATTAGTVTTAAQPNITSTGSLTGLTVSNATGVVNFTTTANVTLGAVGNLHISGGTSGQYLQTNGSGGLSWTTVSTATPSLQDVTTAGAETNEVVTFTNTTESSSFSSGAVKISGGLGVAKSIHTQTHLAAGQTIYAGQYADFSSWVTPKFIGRDAGATYIQGALINTNANGSADWVAYNDISPTDGSEGWSDMGYTGSTFNDPLYTITKANDGYVFVQGVNGIDGGNFVLASGSLGEHHDLVFATGGFLEENESMRLDHERNIFFVGGHAHSGLSDKIIGLDVNGNANVGGNLNVGTSTYISGTTIGQNNPEANLSIYSAWGMDISTTGGEMSLSVDPSMFGPGEDVIISAGNGGDEAVQSSNGGNVRISAGLAGFNAEGQPDPVGGNVVIEAGTGSGGAGNVSISSGANVWNFDNGGNLTLPGNTFAVNYANGNPVSLSGSANIGNFTFNTNTMTVSPDDNMIISLVDDEEEGYSLEHNVVVSSSIQTRTVLDADEFTIQTDVPGVGHTFSFEGSGNLQIPGSVYTFNSNAVLAAMDAGGHPTASLKSISNTNDPNVFTSIDATYTGANIVVYPNGSNGGGTAKTWSFDDDGNLTVPGSIIPSANISYDLGNTDNSFGNLYVANVTATGTITATGKIGYANGGTVTQTGTGQGVTLHQLTGQITLAKSSWTTGELEIFNVNCNKVGTYDYVIAQVINGTESTFFNVVAFPYVPVANTFQIQVRAMESTTSTPLIQFYIMKASIT